MRCYDSFVNMQLTNDLLKSMCHTRSRATGPPLRASRVRSLEVRMMFVFTVCHGLSRTPWISLVALLTGCDARRGLRLRVSAGSSPGRGQRCCLQVCTHFGQGETGTMISELNTVHSRVATPGPFLLTSFLCTLQPATSARMPTEDLRLIRWLQHSIQGLRLRATLAGFPPACQQTISSSLGHCIVIRR